MVRPTRPATSFCPFRPSNMWTIHGPRSRRIPSEKTRIRNCCSAWTSEDGSIYVHMGPNVLSNIEAVIREVFARSGTGATTTWKRVTAHGDSQRWGIIHDSIIWRTKIDRFIWNPQFNSYDEKYLSSKYTHETPDGRRYRLDKLTSPPARPNMTYIWRGQARRDRTFGRSYNLRNRPVIKPVLIT